MAIQKHTLPSTNSAIWAETDNLNYFVTGAIEPDVVVGVTNESATVPASTRRQYPGDSTTISVSGHSRVFLKDPGRKSGSAIPGKPFRVSDGTENRQMRFTGDWVDVHAFFTGNVPAETLLYSPTGTRYVIAGPDGQALISTRAVKAE